MIRENLAPLTLVVSVGFFPLYFAAVWFGQHCSLSNPLEIPNDRSGHVF